MVHKCIEVKSLSVKSREGYILENIDLDIYCNDMVVVAGPSGGGKSTLVKILSGGADILRDRGLEIEGSAYVLGVDVVREGVKKLVGKIGTMFQNPVNQVFLFTVGEEVAFALENLGFGREEIIDRVDKVLKTVGIEMYRDRNVYTLSLGQIQRVVLASIIAMEPQIIIADEPCAHIDMQTKREFYRTLDGIRKRGATAIVVEHDLDHVLGYATKLLILNRKIIVYGDPIEILNRINIEDYGIQEPLYTKICRALKTRINPVNPEDVAKCIYKTICKTDTDKIANQ